DGSFTQRKFTGSSYGAASAIDASDKLVQDHDWHRDLSRATGLFYSSGRLYYTLSGQSRLYYRYFTVESGVVGATRFVASENVNGIRFEDVNGMFVTTGKIWWGSRADGKLRQATFS